MRNKKKLTLSISSYLIDASKEIDGFNVSEFFESCLVVELQRRGKEIKCPCCGK